MPQSGIITDRNTEKLVVLGNRRSFQTLLSQESLFDASTFASMSTCGLYSFTKWPYELLKM
jgi:hypothetical protein